MNVRSQINVSQHTTDNRTDILYPFLLLIMCLSFVLSEIGDRTIAGHQKSIFVFKRSQSERLSGKILHDNA